ncbi:MAG: serine/threonine protein kinase [Acaryochloris sp. SU_5_25]|nr:serine/threonine protein kinase [Acaryochloris sp. SU_5_25]
MKLLADRYKIIKDLGLGGFSQTYLAKDMQRVDQRRCVIKRLQPQSNDPFTVQTSRRLFKTEVNVLKKLGSHERIPQFYDSFEVDQQFYLVAQYIEGHSLEQELRWWHWPEAKVIIFLQDILETLAFVHQKQVIHRDLKPANLIRCTGLQSLGEHRDQSIALIDFGSVKNRPLNHTAIVGTRGYMPPEQFLGKPCLSSDIYAVGIIALRALTGIDPTQKNFPTNPDTGEILWQQAAKVSPGLAQVLDNMVRQNPRQRYSSAKEALQAIHRLEESIPAPSRRRILQTVGLGVMGLLGTGMAYPALSQELTATKQLKKEDSPQQPRENPQPQLQSLAPADLDQEELKRRYGSYNQCRKAAKAQGIKFTTTPTWQMLVYAFSYSEALQNLSQGYLQAYPNPSLAGIKVEVKL